MCTILAAYLLIGSWGSAAEPWRSDLYPENWTPAYTADSGLFLHDFSYAGYRQGESVPDSRDRRVFDAVTEFHADNSGKTDATAAIQAAIVKAEAAGGIVFLPAGRYRCDGSLRIHKPGVILRGAGRATELVFSQSVGMSGNGHITFQGSLKRGPDILLAADAENRSTQIKATSVRGLKVGDEIAIGWQITDAFIAEHDMTGTWKVFNGQWKPFFRCRITALAADKSPPEISLDIPLRYQAKIRDSASVRIESGYLENCGIESLSICNAVERSAAWKETQVQAIAFTQTANCWARDVHSMASPLPEARGYHLQSGGIRVSDSKQVSIADCRMANPQHCGGGGNGYLFQVSHSNNVLTRDCVAVGGRHNFIQNWDFGCCGCVWLRCSSSGGWGYFASYDPIGYPGYCEFHHSLAMACLIDQCQLADGWYAGNRNDWSSGAGQTVTQSVFWNTAGGGVIRSWQFGQGYIIGTDNMKLSTEMTGSSAKGTAPEDYREGIERGKDLQPQSLYEDQLKRRMPPNPN